MHFKAYKTELCMTHEKLKCSGGHAVVDITEEEKKKADLGVGLLFLAKLDKVEPSRFVNYYCKECDEEFEGAPGYQFENPDEEVAEGMILKERGQYMCKKCNGILGEYRQFEQKQ